ncbi:MAG: MBL fold metallo-hydrolase [Anaerolineae bacterium]
MADITFLGTGNAFSAGRRSNVAFLIEGPEFSMLAETGPMIVEQLDRVYLRPADVDRLFVSHSHGDHVLGFPMLALNRLEALTPLHIYAGVSTVSSLRILSALAFSSLGPNHLDFQWHELSEEGPEEVDLAPGVRLRTAAVDHPPDSPTLAARWDFEGGPSITFVTDTRPCTASVQLAQDSDLLIHEASFSAWLDPDANAAEHYHTTAQQAGEVARKAGCKRLAVVHLSPKIGDHPKVVMEEARGGTDLEVIVPEDGERLSVTR